MKTNQTNYKAFTTAYDQVIHARDIMVTLPHETQAGLEDFLDKWGPEAVGAAPTEGAKPTRFLLDLSGSLRGNPIFSLIAAMRAEGDRLHAAGIPFEILGFTTSTWKGGQSRKDWQNAGRPQNPGRLSDLMHVVFKGMDEAWSDCRDLLGVVLKDGALKENVDGEALEWALSRADGDEEPAALVMVSDGTPLCDSTLSVNPPRILEDHLDGVLDRAIEAGVALQRVRLNSEWDRTGITLRDGIDIPASGVDVRDWIDNVRIRISNRDKMPADTPLERIRMGAGEEVPMNPLSEALSQAVTEASNRLAAESKSSLRL